MRFLTTILSVFALVSASAAAEDDLPRRALFIQVHHYLYLSPLTTCSPAKNRDAIDRLAATLHIPTWRTNNQLFVLSDNLLSPEDRLPIKSAIVAGVRQFCDTSRAQDRVLLYFRGHALEKDGKGYFAPVEGEPGDINTLIPIADIYEQLKACKATQKVVVWDVCPRDPERAAIRSGSAPLSPGLLNAILLSVPSGSGIQAVSPCLTGENSLEYSNPKGEAGALAGSVLFDALRKAFAEVDPARRADPAYPIPIIDAFPAVEKYTTSAAIALGTKQTPKKLGDLPTVLAPIKPNEPLPSGVHFPVPRYLAVAEGKAIYQELALPPLNYGESAEAIPQWPFDPAALKPYLPDIEIDKVLGDSEKYPLRVAVLHAVQTIRDTMKPMGRDEKAIAVVNSPITVALKNAVKKAQEPLAVASSKLEFEQKALEEVKKFRDKETRRWQANYDYVMGQVQLRLAMLNEYNAALGNVRTEALPDLPAGSKGWRLTPNDALNRKNDQELADAAREGLRAAADANKGTPWEILAKRALYTPPGLKWEAMK